MDQTRSSASAAALADADAHGSERVAAAAPPELEGRCAGEAGARGAERMAERDRAAIRVDRSSRWEARAPQAGERLRGEGLVEFDDVELAGLRFGRSVSLPTAGIGPTPMIRGSTPAVA